MNDRNEVRSGGAMRRMMLRAAPVMLAVLGGLNAPQAAAQTPTVWKFAHTTPIPGTVWHRYATEVIPKRVNDATKGALQIQVVSGVIQPADLLSAVREGSIQGGSLLFPYVGATLPNWNVLSLPGLVPDESRYPEVLNKQIIPVIREEARRRYKAEPLAVATFPGAYFFSNGPVDSVEKMKGTKYRAHTPELVQLVQAAGGAAVSLPFGELSGALQRNMVDAYTSALTTVRAAKLYEVTKFAENWPAGLGTYGYMFGTEAIAKLSPEVRRQLTEEMARITTDLQRESFEESNHAAKELQEHGMKFIAVSSTERQRAIALAREKIWPAWAKSAGPVGQQLLTNVEAALK